MRTRTRWAPVLASALAVVWMAVRPGGETPTLAQKGEISDTKDARSDAPDFPRASEPLPVPSDPLPGPNPGAAPAPVAPLPTADPEKAATEFVERTQKEADAAVKALTAEAENLKARLQKVESALKRWQGIQAALNANVRGALPAPRGERATGLPPITPSPLDSSAPVDPSTLRETVQKK